MENEDGAVDNQQTPETRTASAEPIGLRLLTLPSNRSPFEDWYRRIKDGTTRDRIGARLRRVRTGNFGDCKPVGGEVYELRLDFGPGYRIYFTRVGETIVVLLAGGDKSTQQNDINRAIELWKEYKNDAQRFQRRF